jgi:hypothetical protein
MNTWELAVLQAVAQLGGQATLAGIYSHLEHLLPLTAHHLRPTRWSGRPAYQHQVRSHISNLRQAGALRWVSRGMYALTSSGRVRLEREGGFVAV